MDILIVFVTANINAMRKIINCCYLRLFGKASWQYYHFRVNYFLIFRPLITCFVRSFVSINFTRQDFFFYPSIWKCWRFPLFKKICKLCKTKYIKNIIYILLMSILVNRLSWILTLKNTQYLVKERKIFFTFIWICYQNSHIFHNNKHIFH